MLPSRCVGSLAIRSYVAQVANEGAPLAHQTFPRSLLSCRRPLPGASFSRSHRTCGPRTPEPICSAVSLRSASQPCSDTPGAGVEGPVPVLGHSPGMTSELPIRAVVGLLRKRPHVHRGPASASWFRVQRTEPRTARWGPRRSTFLIAGCGAAISTYRVAAIVFSGVRPDGAIKPSRRHWPTSSLSVSGSRLRARTLMAASAYVNVSSDGDPRVHKRRPQQQDYVNHHKLVAESGSTWASRCAQALHSKRS
jgi:hypothetical protein